VTGIVYVQLSKYQVRKLLLQYLIYEMRDSQRAARNLTTPDTRPHITWQAVGESTCAPYGGLCSYSL
jgi:hypothetical protein